MIAAITSVENKYKELNKSEAEFISTKSVVQLMTIKGSVQYTISSSGHNVDLGISQSRKSKHTFILSYVLCMCSVAYYYRILCSSSFSYSFTFCNPAAETPPPPGLNHPRWPSSLPVG
jgi:hypothetical protein